MRSNLPSRVLGLALVLIPGALGLWVVGRTLASYWGRDETASIIVCAMGAALLMGVLELAVRALRTSALAAELSALPATPSEATLDGASPTLATLLRTRLEGSGALSLGGQIAPYLTGLLVMLGLLGTLLGLFETVHGAGRALTASGDVDALRRGLSTPIAGLTRSFGCSAAGIGASAMLGLALALVRRRDSALLRGIGAYATGPLRVLSPARRQARALEQLVQQSAALPTAAGVLDRVGKDLAALSEQLTSSQTRALEAQERALTDVLARLRTELARAAASAGSALQAQIAPLVDAFTERTGSALERQASALGETTRAISRELGEEASARRREAGELLDALTARIDAAERARSEAHGRELAALTELSTRALREAERRSAALEEHARALSAQLEASVCTLRDAEASQRTRLDDLAAGMSERLSELSAALGREAEVRRALEAEHAAHTRAALDAVRASAHALTESARGQGASIEGLVTRVPALLEQVAEATEDAAKRALGELVEHTDERLVRLSALLDEELAGRSTRERAEQERAREAMARLGESAALLDRSMVRQGELLDGLVSQVSELLAKHAERIGERGEAALARIADAADQQAERFTLLSAELHKDRTEHAERLVEQAARQEGRFAELTAELDKQRAAGALDVSGKLEAHARGLAEQLSGTNALVRDAAAGFSAAVAEMQAVAALFASSVERQREASDAWLESLGEIEAAVEQAGRTAAADALSDQLASTQEVFARQLQFQRELFEQLRSLRGAGARTAAHGEHDASV